jgi:hypothetical protein
VNWPLSRKNLKLETEGLELDVATAKEMITNFYDGIVAAQEFQVSRKISGIVEKQLMQCLANSKLVLLNIEVKPLDKIRN